MSAALNTSHQTNTALESEYQALLAYDANNPPEMANLPGSSTRDYSAFTKTLTLINSPNGKSLAPELNAMVSTAAYNTNKASLLDAPLSESDILVYVSNAPEVKHNARRMGINSDGKHVIVISEDFLKLPNNALQAVLDHELSHSYQEKPMPDRESDADRGIKDPIAAINFFLIMKESNTPEYGYYNNEGKDDRHTPFRDRVINFLSKAYGDDVFGKRGGEFGDDHRFHPREVNGVYYTENFSTATNWKTEVAPAIAEQVRKDITQLDRMMRDGYNDAERMQYIAQLQQNVADFRAAHPVRVAPPSAETMATVFEAVNQTAPKGVEAALSMHPNMQLAFEAVSNLAAHVNTAIADPAAREQVMQACIANVANQIRAAELDSGNIQPCER